ncbi:MULTISPECIES: UDP-N-acetylmuramoyl-L-alanine--D-glutamate ligase [Dictyoglomus]|jgi:UDP-N-acetylmuramoylalanine--D-glutamate ligase|uniref:UDP-N-acetylmuramoylalanine--D-glutamate ligase n=1 Tax=Dictyoglomus turgidum (strain DSM 6724 / Z-1310) TaxID=515635 RepID=B8E327_DICTD|nr:MULTISPECIES: UDP-N-acetylmuramoyl-L-alanine--D-glutamate ligase [Dictyoglomus]ACK42527.1 UDP-N-acetylmuramoylalanine/D-glutamate ligase [Dictyoglomus turgidum DSM 6724]PNV79911.1 MAG: UDP-N-acetylmuramoyl-L-alanine--D-glutamate ligase [Dictyoglomus turgidum]HBU32268.1 UDP-N-acetylmuramoyl-L-alanine--D-glutamate ligase [Dictyoglomus sp.]
MEFDLKGKRVLVLGLGESGISTTKFLKEEGAKVIVNDYKEEEDFKNLLDFFRNNDILYIFGGHPIEILRNIDLVVISPGIPKTNPIYIEAKKRDIKVISEIELAYWYAKVPIIAITGTKGKSTTTTLIGEILKNAGIPNIVAGNIGLPFISVVKDLKEGYFVLEVSSFQLEDIEKFRPFISLFINIYPDHLDRYSSMDEYMLAKSRIFMNQKEEDYAILSYDQEEIINLAKPYKVKKLFFGFKKHENDGIFYDESRNKVFYKLSERYGSLTIPKGIWNRILISNFMASALVGLLLGVEERVIEKTGEDFQGIPFALQRIGELNGRVFVNDSKATNPVSTSSAINSINSPIILILGGRNKNFDFHELFENIKKSKVRRVVLIGETKEIMRELSEEYEIPYVIADSLEDAVRRAYEVSEPGDVILLSPACASFDMFRNYKERGKIFNDVFERMKNEKV